ncbi:MAG: peptidoglycan DD-metalloendopeptidase family protein [Pseudomonadota bacterium]
MTKEISPFPGFSYSPHCWKFIGFILLLLIGLTILSCAGYPLRSERPRGIYHRVKSGETLFAIARAYQVNLQDLAEINNISNPDQIEVDSVIFVPDANQVLDDVLTAARSQKTLAATPVAEAPVVSGKAEVSGKEIPKKAPVAGAVKSREAVPVDVPTKDRAVLPRAAERNSTLPRISDKPESEKIENQPVKQDIGEREGILFDKKRFIWPVKGKVVSQFGIQPNRMSFNGIRIAAGEGTAVQAAAGGSVIFSALLKDYGETIIIKHDDYYATVYTHLGIRTVREETQIKKGDRIAFLGKADGREEPYLHFEIRYKNKARNPLFFLP